MVGLLDVAVLVADVLLFVVLLTPWWMVASIGHACGDLLFRLVRVHVAYIFVKVLAVVVFGGGNGGRGMQVFNFSTITRTVYCIGRVSPSFPSFVAWFTR